MRADLRDLLRPHGLAASSQQVYFTAEESRQIGMLDVASGKVDAVFLTDQDITHMVAALTAWHGCPERAERLPLAIAAI